MEWGMSILAGHLFDIAREAARRACAQSSDPRGYVAHDPFVAAVFSAAAGEAFINELPVIAEHPSKPDPELSDPPEVQHLISLLGEAESARYEIRLKFLLAKLALTRRTFDKGVNPYQDFATLIDLRNALLHMKSERIEGVLAKGSNPTFVHPKLISRLRGTNVLASAHAESSAGWTYLVSTPAAATWACNATASIVRDLHDSMPHCQLKAKMNIFYFSHGAFDMVV
ncbi:MAG: hypothetical protein JXE06_01320 [Coriobacteriia bacterium]|nr:hypothetical protein [Coriobacteriia bacterium]